MPRPENTTVITTYLDAEDAALWKEVIEAIRADARGLRVSEAEALRKLIRDRAAEIRAASPKRKAKK